MRLTPEEEVLYEGIAKVGIDRDRNIYIAPLLIGAAIDFVLLGVVSLQLVIYAGYARRDRLFNQITVLIIGLFSWGFSIFVLCYIIHIFSTNFGRYLTFVIWNWLNWFPLLGVTFTTTVSIFYVHRAYKLYKSKWVLIVVLPFMLAAVAGAVATKVVSGSYLATSVEADKLKPYVYLWIGGDFTMGLLLTGLILYRLFRSKNGAEVDRVINRMARVSAESQIVATVMAVAFMICYSVEPNSAVNVCFEPKVHVIGLMAVLNRRRALRRVLHRGEVCTADIPDRSGHSPDFEEETMSIPAIRYSQEGGTRSSLPANYSTGFAVRSKAGIGSEKSSDWGSNLETAMGSPVLQTKSYPIIKEEKLGV